LGSQTGSQTGSVLVPKAKGERWIHLEGGRGKEVRTTKKKKTNWGESRHEHLHAKDGLCFLHGKVNPSTLIRKYWTEKYQEGSRGWGKKGPMECDMKGGSDDQKGPPIQPTEAASPLP